MEISIHSCQDILVEHSTLEVPAYKGSPGRTAYQTTILIRNRPNTGIQNQPAEEQRIVLYWDNEKDWLAAKRHFPEVF